MRANQATLITQTLTGDAGQRRRRAAADLPPAIDDAVMKALSKDASDRWPSVTSIHRRAAGRARTVAGAGARQPAMTGLLSRYELGGLLGRGRLGSLVYQGTHRALGIPVAIRVLKRDEQPHWDAVRARFLLEARTLQVSHPSLLQVRDFGEDDRSVYLVTDLIDGPSLRQAMAEAGPMPWQRARNLIAAGARCRVGASRQGRIHLRRQSRHDSHRARERRTDRLDERIVISSAGIKSVQDVLATMREQELRGQEASANELPYVAPEVLMGGAPNPRADVFTIGVLAYQMVTGTAAVQGRVAAGVDRADAAGEAAPPAGEMPDGARDAILKAIDSMPANRFESADAFAARAGMNQADRAAIGPTSTACAPSPSAWS